MMNEQIKQFIEENIELIEKDTKESWEEIYHKLGEQHRGEFTETMLEVEIDPAKFMEHIPNYYLYNSSIEEYEIPDNVTFIGDSAFYECKSLKSVYVRDIAAWCNILFGNDLANPFYYAENLYLNNELVTELIIPSTVTKIKDSVFRYCLSLTSIIIPDSVKSIGKYAFFGCKNLMSVVIGDSVTSIDYSAFYNCESLKSVKIGNSVTSIGEFAFRHCSSLTSIAIPDSVTSIGDCAFGGCRSLTELTYNGTKKEAYTIFKVKNKGWGEESNINKIICTDGVIELDL